ncbi:MAG: hypothetical protein MK089_00140 [Phycisphaerales bacterium]|nr:hypothetical protein [Phycisphaerales bacterium]
MTDTSNTTELTPTLRAAVAPSYTLRVVLTGLMCLVLGVWGIYDYVWAIPATEEGYLRAEICRNVRASLDGIANGDEELTTPTIILIDESLASPLELPEDGGTTSWQDVLGTFRDAIEPPSTLSPTDVPQLRKEAMDLADAQLVPYAGITEPSKYDRPVQWLFILCLPFVPYYAWAFFTTKSRRYELDADGTLHMPEATWTSDELVEIDMNRWMAKSICWVIGKDGERIKLDAYVYKKLDVIIGVIAHKLHPEAWNIDARPVKNKTDEKNASLSDSSEDSEVN